MRIINDTNNSAEYIVTPSGRPLNESKVLASGIVFANEARIVDVESKFPFNVYLKPVSNNEDFAFRQISNTSATVRVRIEEE